MSFALTNNAQRREKWVLAIVLLTLALTRWPLHVMHFLVFPCFSERETSALQAASKSSNVRRVYLTYWLITVLTSLLIQADLMLTGRLFQLTPWCCSHEGSIPHGNFWETLWGAQKNSLTRNPSGKKHCESGGTLKQFRLKKNTKITRPKTFLSNSNEKGQYFTFFSFVDKHTTKKEGKSTRRVSE